MPNQYRKYEQYDVTEFVLDDDFIHWIKTPNPQNNLFWQGVIAANPHQAQNIQHAKKLLLSIDTPFEKAPEEIKNRIWKAIQLQTANGRVVKMNKQKLWMAAASIIVILLAAGWYLASRDTNKKQVAAGESRSQQNDILPGGNKAVLTLSDGTRVILDTADNGAITRQGSVTVIKLNNGQLAYDKEGVASTEVFYNTISTPKGGQYQLVLADGSKVWLNAASSLRFPTVFPGKERIVELTGEGYFEVAHDAERPFHVAVNGMDVKVLGTHFNINAYEDEEKIRTTLLQGSVKVSRGSQTVLLHPGEQAQTLDRSSAIKVVPDVDVDDVIAWKNGYFSFHQANIQTVMRQLARWYDVVIEYKGDLPDRVFEGEMQRDLMLSQALKILEKNRVHFKVEGKKIVIMP